MDRFEQPGHHRSLHEDEQRALFEMEMLGPGLAAKNLEHCRFVHTPFGTLDVVDREGATTKVYEFDNHGRDLRAIVTESPDHTVSQMMNPHSRSIDTVIRDNNGGVLTEGASDDRKHYDVFVSQDDEPGVHLELPNTPHHAAYEWRDTGGYDHRFYRDCAHGSSLAEDNSSDGKTIQAENKQGNYAQLHFETSP